jgi:hypothetical protein
MKTLDIVIPVCNMFPASTKERIATLNFSLRGFYAKQTGVKLRIILVEQVLSDGGPRPYMKNVEAPKGIEVERVAINYPVFNKPWCCNVGVRHVESPVFLLAEADMFCQQDYLSEALEWMEKTNSLWCFAWDHLYYTTKAEKHLLVSGKQLLKYTDGRRTVPKRRRAEGGLVLFNTQFWKDMGWANEWIEELGGPDNDLAERARFVSRYYRAFPQKVLHLWHERVPLKDRPTRLSNIQIVKLTRRCPTEVQKILKQCDPGITEAPRCIMGNFIEIVAGYTRIA